MPQTLHSARVSLPCRRALLVTFASSAIAWADEPPEDGHHHATHSHPVALQTSESTTSGHSVHQHAAVDHGQHGYGMVLGGHAHHADAISATLGMTIADYDSRLYSGEYQGAIVGARWMSGRFGLGVSLAAYHLTKNGRAIEGIGDLMLHGHATIAQRGAWSAGGMLMTSIPTADARAGLGMGHLMFMPEAWGMWTGDRLSVTGTAGFGYAMGGAGVHAEHGGGGAWPLVEPMNGSELTYGASGMLALAPTLGAGIGFKGAIPTSEGISRLSSSLRVLWITKRVDTAVEIQHGLAGDPFGLRGLVETVIRFN